MSLSRIAVEQREKEAKNLNSFLAFSLIGSLALHIGVLSLGIGKFLSKVAEPENEPIEIAIVELPNPQKLELKPEKAKDSSTAGNDGAILSSSGGSGGFGAASGGGTSQEKSSPQKIASSNSTEIFKAQPAPQRLSQTISKAIPTPPQNQKITLEKVPAVVTPSKPVMAPARTAPSEIVTKPKFIIPPSPVPVASTKPAPVDTNPTAVDRSSQIQQLNNQRLNGLLANAKNAREASRASNSGVIGDRQGKIAANNLRNKAQNSTSTGNGNGNGTSLNNSGTGNGNGNGTGTGTGSGNGTGTGTGGTGRGNNNVQSGSTVATGARNIERRTSPEASNTNTNTGSSGRLACRTCSKPKYPESARKRRLEGKAEISVDVDSKGNVTNVRLARTSGHSDLDKAAVEQARNWKFNAPNGAAQGVTAKVDFAIEGSKKSRQNRERRRQRTAARQQPVSSQNTQTQPYTGTTTTSSTQTPTTRSLRRQSTTVRRRRVEIPPRQAYDQPQRRQQSGGQTRLRDTLKRSQSSNQTRIRRSQSSPNQTKLRQSLRLYQQKSPSTPTNEP